MVLRTLAVVAQDLRLVPAIHYTTVAKVLRQAEINVQRLRYCETAVWDDEAIERTIHILWRFEHVAALGQRDEVVFCVVEKPSIQALERRSQRSLGPGQPLRQEFEYARHGVTVLLAGLQLHTGQMHGGCLRENNGANFRLALPAVPAPDRSARRIHLIMDNGASHTAGDTSEYLKDHHPNVRVLFTPPHASWLNQAEPLLGTFTKRYLRPARLESLLALQEHIEHSTPSTTACSPTRSAGPGPGRTSGRGWNTGEN